MSTQLELTFRHDAARLVAVLARRVGLHQLEAVEDAVQSALLIAVTNWATHGIPSDRAAWLYRVAMNELREGWRRKSPHVEETVEQSVDPIEPAFDDELNDEQLRMIFVCCDERLPEESRLVFALKTLCSFSTAEIAARLLITEANVSKRLSRARGRLREGDFEPVFETLGARLPSVHSVLYLLFNEGHLGHGAQPIRVELCDEALRLCTVLATHRLGAKSSTFALLALMHLHAARLPARRDAMGGLVLLDEQDRARWDHTHLQQGAVWLERAGQGDTFMRFHAEAAIAAEHAFAPSFAETNWREIASIYSVLAKLDPSALHALNRAVALAEVDGPLVALEALDHVALHHPLRDAVLADLHRRAGHVDRFEHHRALALATAASPAIREALERRLKSTR